MDVATKCVTVARDFWQLDPKWRIGLRVAHLGEEALGQADVRPEYYKAYIELHNELESAEEVWRVTAHELAHLALASLQFWQQSHWPEADDMPEPFRFALEQATVTLEQVFVRENPYEEEQNA